MKRVAFALFSFFYATLANGQAPSWAWAKEAFSNNAELAKGVAADPSHGDVIVVGDFTGDIRAFCGANFVGALGAGFVAKYNSCLLFLFKDSISFFQKSLT